VEYRVLGPLEVWSDGRQVPLGGGRQRDLLAMLLLHAGEVVSRERLIDGLWGEGAPESADKIVQNHVSHLRRSLGPDTVLTRGRGYQLDLDGGRLDLDEFRELRGSGELRAALALWRGDAFADCRLDAVAKAEAQGLDELRLATLEERIDADLAEGRHREVVGEVETLVVRHPYRERFWEQLMAAQNASGRPADALATYQRARRTMSDELGLEPGPSLRRLERAILTQDPALEAQAAAPGERPAGRRRRRSTGAAIAGVAVAAAAAAIVVVGFARTAT
jgi:DNA-binding SARP family transcriptional activator